MRDYTDQELDELLDKRELLRMLNAPVCKIPEDKEPVTVEPSAALIRAEAERDVYRSLYEKLLGMMAPAGRSEAIG